jgi:hypothetical protein
MLRPTERKKVQWSPHHANQFVVGANDLRLYEIRSSVRIERLEELLKFPLCPFSLHCTVLISIAIGPISASPK